MPPPPPPRAPDTVGNSGWQHRHAGYPPGPILDPDEIAVLCKGRYLQEGRICRDRDLHPRSCDRDVRGRCRCDEAIVRPVR